METVESYLKKGDSLRAEGKWEEALESYKKVIELDPENWLAHHHSGDYFFQQENWEKAIFFYQNAISLNSEFNWSYCNLGRALSKTGKFKESVESFQKAIENDPNFAIAYSYLAEVLLELKDKQGAIENYKKAVEISPDERWAKLLLETVLDNESNNDNGKNKKIKPTEHLRPSGIDLQSEESVYNLIKESNLFNVQYYRTQNPTLNSESDDLLEHYIKVGAFEGLNPNPLFNNLFYLEQNPELIQPKLNPLAHYIDIGAKEGKNPNPVFETSFYLEDNPDLAQSEMNPLEHYLDFGMLEGRIAWSVNKVAAFMKTSVREQSSSQLIGYLNQEISSASLSPHLNIKIGIYCSSLGNYFMTEIADLIAQSLEKIGITAIRLSETDQNYPNIDYNIIVAPHEFFYLGEGQSWRDFPNLSRSIMINVEQPHTEWFSKSLYFLQKAAIAFDINLKSATVLEQLGVNVYYLPLSYLEDFTPFEFSGNLPDTIALKGLTSSMKNNIPQIDEPIENRPIDVHFIGALNQYREQFFASSASWLSQYRCFLHIPPVDRPLIRGQDWMLDTQAVIGLSRLSKILLNIHREETPYFEWHRIVFHGLWQKTLVVTEPCHEVPGFISGEHYIECEANQMPDKIHWLLKTPAGKKEAERVRLNGYEALKNYLSLSQIMEKALGLIVEFCSAEKEVNHND